MNPIAFLGLFLLTLVKGQYAIVQNDCNFPIWIRSFPYNGGSPGQLTKVASGTAYRENFRPSGSTIKMATDSSLTHPLFFGYSLTSSPNLVYYELSSRFGNPFSGYYNDLSSKSSCAKFDCAPGNANCYSTPQQQKVYSCQRPASVTATICAPS